MYIPKAIADRIRSAAKSSGVVIKDMLAEVNLGENTLHNMNTSMPKADNLAKIADYLGVSVDYLLGRQNETAPAESRSGKGASMPESEWAQILSQMSPESLIQLRDYTRYLLWKQAQAAGDSQ